MKNALFFLYISDLRSSIVLLVICPDVQDFSRSTRFPAAQIHEITQKEQLN